MRGKALPTSALNHVMYVLIKSICNKTLIAPFRVQYVFYCGHLDRENKG